MPPLSRVALYQCTVLRAIHLQLGLQATSTGFYAGGMCSRVTGLPRHASHQR